MTDTLTVAVNRDGLHTLAVPAEFEATGPFAIELHNHGEAAHVHLNLDDRLSAVARLKATNHYVESGETRRIEIETRDPSSWSETVRGKLKVVVGHGQETHYVDVLFDRPTSPKEVRVDPELAKPNTDPDPELPPLVRVLPVVAFASVAVLLAVGALFASNGIDTVIGTLALVAAGLCAASAYYLLG